MKSNIKNTIYEEFYDDLYHPDLKIRFVEENYPNSEMTKRTVLNDFRKSAIVEKIFDKDLCIMNINEINEVAKILGYITINTIQAALSRFSVYTDYCIANRLRGSYENNINNVAIFMKTQDLSKFIAKLKNMYRYITREEIYDAVDLLTSYIDKALLLAPYEGIAGEKLYELTSLTKDDINFDTNQVTLTDVDGKKRTKTISNKLVNILKYASSEKEYISANTNRKRLLTCTPYIIRSVENSNVTTKGVMAYSSLSSKFNKIKRTTGLNHVTPQSIQDSGQINRVIELTKQYNLSEPTDDIFKILQRPDEYNLSTNQYYNLKQKYKIATSLKEFW